MHLAWAAGWGREVKFSLARCNGAELSKVTVLEVNQVRKSLEASMEGQFRPLSRDFLQWLS